VKPVSFAKDIYGAPSKKESFDIAKLSKRGDGFS
jgi:hypothetical protein